MDMSITTHCWGEPDVTLLCCGGAALALGAAFLHSYRAVPEFASLAQKASLLSGSILSFVVGLALVVKGW